MKNKLYLILFLTECATQLHRAIHNRIKTINNYLSAHAVKRCITAYCSCICCDRAFSTNQE